MLMISEIIPHNVMVLDDAEVVTTELTHRVHRAAPCDLLVRVTPNNREKALKAFQDDKRRLQYSGLHVSGVADLSFLKDFEDLRYLEITDQKNVDTRCLDRLYNLRGLTLTSPGAGIDFSGFPLLEQFIGNWHPANKNLNRCDELRSFTVWGYKPKSRDLRDFADVTRLEWLTIVDANITSLDGVETLEDLRYLHISIARQLESVDALKVGKMGIQEIAINNSRKIATYDPLAALPRLRRLKLGACAQMPDLKWTKGMNYLDSLAIVETVIEDGDLSPLLELPRLRYVGTLDKKHYNYKYHPLNKLLEERYRASRNKAT
jgi:hypothetical protein